MEGAVGLPKRACETVDRRENKRCRRRLRPGEATKLRMKDRTPSGFISAFAIAIGVLSFNLQASAITVTGTTVTTATELQDALDDALARNSSSVIDVRVTGREYSATLAAIRG